MMRQCQGDDWLVLQTSINWKLLRGRKGDLSPCLLYISIPTFHLEPCPSYLWVCNKFMLDNRVKVFSIKKSSQESAQLILWWWFQKQTRLQGGNHPLGVSYTHFTPPETMSYISFSAVQPLPLWITWGKHWMKSHISCSPDICWLLRLHHHTWHVFVGASASQGIGQSCQWYGHLGLLRVLAEYSQFGP